MKNEFQKRVPHGRNIRKEKLKFEKLIIHKWVAGMVTHL